MNYRRFGLKSALGGAVSGLFAMGAGLRASAQEEEAEDEGTPTGAAADDTGSVAVSGDTTVSVINGVPSIITAEPAAEDDGTDDGDGADDGDDGLDSEISADSSLAIADASGGDGNFAFTS